MAATPAAGRRPAVTWWLWLVLGASVLFVIAGVATFWNSNADRSYYGYAPGSDEAFTAMVASFLSPALVEIGTIGVVATCLAFALFAGRSRRRR
ncbi:hypothetical protein GE115_07425 [Agromyces sp. CFH 90414]|uniref:Uncharacterized protein n=1 Tax=Agromyces agglutinans TaxID=2662258 RepID=A0A6I2F531_9MICO|nr:hypothetical protein [Agromyces agglutinans]MRG59699.1 hypothetical protein [Agromyces agglutinans]